METTDVQKPLRFDAFELDPRSHGLTDEMADFDPALAYVAVEPRVDSIRTDLRYARLIARLGLG